jgi:hypothetical protein
VKEKPKHREAYEYFYNLGDHRTNRKVAEAFKVSEQSVCNWRKAFNWDKRADQRDLEIATKIERKTNRTIVESKAEYREDIRRSLNIIKRAWNQLITYKDGENGKEIVIKGSAQQINQLSLALDRLIKLDLIVMGEAVEIGENQFTFEVVGVDVDKFPSPAPASTTDNE